MVCDSAGAESRQACETALLLALQCSLRGLKSGANDDEAEFGATGRNRTCDVAFGGPNDIHFTTVARGSGGF